MQTEQRQRGNHAEDMVCKDLERQGFTILARNYAIRGGELDIVARKKDLVVCVEVKMRSKKSFDLATVITPTKQRKIILTTKYFLAVHNLDDVDVRFDVALVEPDDTNALCLTYLQNAFQDEEW